MKKVLVTGGAGYIGSRLCSLLLSEGFEVRVIDNLKFGGEAIIPFLSNPSFSFYKGDVRNQEDRKIALKGIKHVVHLAAIVGDPACSKEPEIARETNLEASKKLYQDASKAGCERFIFASTCSNYGKMEDENGFVNEESVLNPISIYAETKVATEQYLLNEVPKESKCIPTCLRFSTVHGVSPRPRFDLTVNEFTRELTLKRELVVFGEQFWRPYCHVQDLARAVLYTLKADLEKVQFDVFNVGSTEENYQKKMIVEEILKLIPDAKVKYVKKDEDPRDYRVSFQKIKNTLGFEITKTVPESIREMKSLIEDGFFLNPDSERYSNI